MLTEEIVKQQANKGNTVLNVRLKCSKEAKSEAPTIADVFQTSEGTEDVERESFCPGR